MSDAAILGNILVVALFATAALGAAVDRAVQAVLLRRQSKEKRDG
jgi:hypothetical protein